MDAAGEKGVEDSSHLEAAGPLSLEEPELQDYATTVDPSHIVRLIRKLLPDHKVVKKAHLQKGEGEEEGEGAGEGEGGGEKQSCVWSGGASKGPLLDRLCGPARRGDGDGEGWEEREGGAGGEGVDKVEGTREGKRPVLDDTGCKEEHREEGRGSAEDRGERDDIWERGQNSEDNLQEARGLESRKSRKRGWDDGMAELGEKNVTKHEGKNRESHGDSMKDDEGMEKQEMEVKEEAGEGGGVGRGNGSDNEYGGGKEVEEDPREEAGCLLWDLAASESHADFLVKSHILEVLVAILQIPYTNRIREISLGILGNLACHPGPERAMVQTKGLVQLVVQQLFGDDPPSLMETCRLLSAGLHSEEAATWIAAIDSEEVLGRIMWMAANTVHAQLLEKSTELLLAMVDGRTEVSSPLLPGLLRLGLPELLTDMMASELTAVTEGTSGHGDLVLDIVLQITEALSLSDDCAEQLAADRKLFSLACQVVRLSGSDEIGPSGITATVLLANLLAEDVGLIHELAHDIVLAGSLLSLIPGAGDDPGARNALWSILGRMCRRLVSPLNGEEPYGLAGMAAVFAEGCHLVVEDLTEHREEDLEEDEDRAQAGHDVSTSTSRGLEAKLITASNMALVMEQWLKTRGQSNGHTGQLLTAVQVACSKLRGYVAGSQTQVGALRKRQLEGHRNGLV